MVQENACNCKEEPRQDCGFFLANFRTNRILYIHFATFFLGLAGYVFLFYIHLAEDEISFLVLTS
jgi:hypothetical protein